MNEMKNNKVEKLIDFVGKTENVDQQALVLFLEQLDLQEEDVSAWSDLDHPPSDSYGRKTIAKGARFELMVMTWLPKDFSMIHNHGDASWGVVQPLGGVRHRIYSLEEMKLFLVKEEKLIPQKVYAVSHELIHQMGNDSSEPILTVHFYWNENAQEVITNDTFLFDTMNNEILTVQGGAFYALPQDEIARKKSGLQSNDQLRSQEEKHLKNRLNATTSL